MNHFINKTLIKTKLSIFILLLMNSLIARETLPYSFINTSQYSDNDIYVGIVGITDGHVWIDCKNSTVHPMSISDNTIQGPVIDGNMGPGNNALYANCFTKLSDVPNKTVNMPKIAGCRILISFGSPLYLYFFGHSGAPSGYAAPNLANSTDPNSGIRFEMIELTWNDIGLWTNTTRVDSYQYPMGLEVWGGGSGFYKKVGEIKKHNEIISAWKNRVSSDFIDCLDESIGIIKAPSKTVAFEASGSNANYMKSYIDQIWEKYKNEDLTFTSDAGIWKGRVEGERFVFHNLTNDFGNATGIVSRRPDTQEAFEGKGVLAEDVQKLSTQTLDLVVQAQICAALNRGVIDLSAPMGSIQEWGDDSNYFKSNKYNEYVKFWHDDDISYEKYSYGFCYDDVYDHSSTIHSTDAQRVAVTIGGFGNDGNTSISTNTAKKTELKCDVIADNQYLEFNYYFKKPTYLTLYTLKGELIFDKIIIDNKLSLNPDIASGLYVWKVNSEDIKSNGFLTITR